MVDIEGTITSLDYVKVELMGWVRQQLPAWVAAHPDHPAVQAAAQAWNTSDVTAHALQLMDQDAKVRPVTCSFFSSLSVSLWLLVDD